MASKKQLIQGIDTLEWAVSAENMNYQLLIMPPSVRKRRRAVPDRCL